jgi:formylglycine-generating enzyme required for sulfatase activity/tRNA A-37 threonylcarbamoyl transferase component Bud32
MPPREDPFGWVGHVIDDKYRIDSVVGEGGFGVVYRAHHLGFEQAVAVKCLKITKNLEGELHDAFLNKFLAEGRLLHRLSRATADVVQALDVGVAISPKMVETPYLVLEWLDGTTLDKELKKRRGTHMPLDEAAALLEPAARGLAFAHEQGISHRDVKPANLMLTDISGRLTMKVVDFGIAKAPTDEPTQASPHDGLGSGMQAFTPRYGAPEQFSRKFGPTGTFTDVYALALIYVELVSGAPALEGDDPVQLYVATSDEKHRPTLRAKGIEVNDAVEAVIQRALEIDHTKRYATAGEFWDALQNVLDRPKISSVRPPAISLPAEASIPKAAPVPAFESAPQVSEIYVPPAQRSGATGTGTITVMLREQRKRRLVWLGALAVTIVVVVAAFLGMRDAEKQTTTTPSASASSSARLAVSSRSSASASPSAVASVAPVEVDAASPVPHGMILVPAGTFTMGSDNGSRNEKPQHQVHITRDFYIDATEVTADAYGACVRDHACTMPRLHALGAHGRTITTSSTSCNSITDPSFARQPVNCVTYEQSVSFCKHDGKRLPTEAEWEYAARGTDGRTYPWGEAESHSCRFAITGGAEGPCGARKGTYEVATTVDGKSPFGLFDMAGNVWEWVADDFEGYGKDEVVDPIIPPRSSKGVIRGGSWDYSAATAKTYARMSHDRTFALNNVGFRCAKDVTP